jgi:hypothetical protein
MLVYLLLLAHVAISLVWASLVWSVWKLNLTKVGPFVKSVIY